MIINHGAFSKNGVSIHDLTVDEITELDRGDRMVKVSDPYGCWAEFHLRYTPEFGRALSEAKSDCWACEHAETALRTKVASNGRYMVSQQCLRCGNRIGDYVKKENWPKEHTLWDETISGDLRSSVNEKAAVILLQFIAKQQQEEKRYGEYLLSPQWRRKRQLVLERDNHLCQGCRNATATEVHHLTYRDIYDEFLFQLIGLCEGCHDRYHAEDPE